jgi:hypothetical protein
MPLLTELILRLGRLVMKIPLLKELVGTIKKFDRRISIPINFPVDLFIRRS